MRLRRQAAVLVLAFILAAPWIAAAKPRLEGRGRAEQPVVSVSEFLSHVWSLLTSPWGAAPACDAGLGMDPLGCPAKPTTDEGLGMDPLGSPATDEGLGADPLG